MVKGISRQVIVVQSPDKDLFEQAIFILTDAAVEKGVTDQMLLKQAATTLQLRIPRHPPIHAKENAHLLFWSHLGLGRCWTYRPCLASIPDSLTCQNATIVVEYKGPLV